MYNVDHASFIIREEMEEARKRINSTLGKLNPSLRDVEGKLTRRAISWNLDAIKNYIQNTEDNWDLLFVLSVRNRNEDEIKKSAEAVVSIMKEHGFSIVEALLFLRYVEGMVMSSSVD